VKALKTAWLQKKAQIFAGKLTKPDFEDPDTVNHLNWYLSTGLGGPNPARRQFARRATMEWTGEWRMSEVFAELFGRFFLALANATAIDDYIVIVRDTVNPNGSEGEVLELLSRPPCELSRTKIVVLCGAVSRSSYAAATVAEVAKGSRAITVVPWPFDWMSKPPPNCRNRSRMPRIPTPGAPADLISSSLSSAIPFPSSSTSK